MKTIAKPFATGLAAALVTLPAWSAGFAPLSDAGRPVLTTCEGVESQPNPTRGVCKVTGSLPVQGAPGPFPGQTGTWSLVRSNVRQAVVANGTRIGDLDDKVWQKAGTSEYVFGLRLQLQNVKWTPPSPACADTTPTYFEINDLFRAGFGTSSGLSVAYKLSGADDGIFLAGRTTKGLNQYDGSPAGLNPPRNKTTVNFRTDLNYEDPDGTSPANSAWLLLAANLPGGVSTSVTKDVVRLRQGGEEGQCEFEITLRGFKPL